MILAKYGCIVYRCRNHSEDCEQEPAITSTSKQQGAQSPTPEIGGTSHRQANWKSCPRCPLSECVVWENFHPRHEARQNPISQDSNQQKALFLRCQVSGGSLNENSEQHPSQKRGSRLDKCPTPAWEPCDVTPPHFLCGELRGGPLCTCVWGGVGEGVRQNKSLGPASGHENAPERTRT